MGSDNLHHKRKARKSEELQRTQGQRAQHQRYLIVCEGTKTEPHYLREYLDDLGIPPSSVRIEKNDGTAPSSIGAHALKLYDEDQRSGDPYDKVYCVFDKDNHASFHDAVQRTKDLSEAGKPFVAITSIPCFEVWFLLHFGFTDQSFHAAGKKSVGDQVVAKLKTKPGFANYGKGENGIYDRLKPKLADALTHTAQLRAQSADIDKANPSTQVDQLIHAIAALKPKRKAR